MNRVTLIGNVTFDPELRKTPKGTPVASFGFATNMYWKDASTGEKRENAEFHSIIAWRKLAEPVGEQIKTGNRLYIEGRLKTRTWEDKEGVKRRRTEVIASNILVLKSKADKKGEETVAEKPMLVEEEVSTEKVPF